MIRKACIDDASRIAEILIFAKRSTYRKIFKNDKVSFGEMQVLPVALGFIDDPTTLNNILVYDDEFVKGMARVIVHINYNVKILEVAEIYVEPFFHNMGVGTKLLKEIELYATKNEFKEIYLWVLEKNENACAFYEKQGFTPTSHREIEKGTSEYKIKYSKST